MNQANDFEYGQAARRRGAYNEALQIFRQLADQGHSGAMLELSSMYALAEGVTWDSSEANRLLRRAADQGDPEAQYILGSKYESYSSDLPQNHSEACKWMLRSAARGHELAQFWLGVKYTEGIVLPRDGKEAYRWFLRAANQGNIGASFALAHMYANGLGVQKNYIEAYKWCSLSFITDANTLRDKITVMMTPADIAEGKRLVVEWKPKAEVYK